MSDRYLTKAEYAQAKRRLTVATKQGPQAVIDCVNHQFTQWDTAGKAYPDDWHRWERARDDAQYQLQREAQTWLW